MILERPVTAMSVPEIGMPKKMQRRKYFRYRHPLNFSHF